MNPGTSQNPRRQIHKAYELTTSWQKLEPYDAQRRGLILQNQTGNSTANIYVSEGEPRSNLEALELVPSGVIYEDLLPAQGQLWARTDAVGGATLTVVLKY